MENVERKDCKTPIQLKISVSVRGNTKDEFSICYNFIIGSAREILLTVLRGTLSRQNTYNLAESRFPH